MKGKVYCEVLKEYKRPYFCDEKAVYLVKYGYADWYKDGNKVLAVYVLMQYNGRIKYINPPHLLVDKNDKGISDFTRVMKALNKLMREFKLSENTKKEE